LLLGFSSRTDEYDVGIACKKDAWTAATKPSGAQKGNIFEISIM
jgi:hypothetical protein